MPPVAAATRSRTRTTRSASSSSGVNGSTAAVAAAGRLGGDRVWRHRQERAPGVQSRLLEQAAAPADARQLERLAGARRDAVRGQRLVGARGGAGEHLVAALAPGRDDDRGAEPLGRVADDAGPRVGRVGVERVVLGHVCGRDAVRAEAGRGLTTAGADEQGVDRAALREPAREGQRLQRDLRRLAVAVVAENEQHLDHPQSAQHLDDGRGRAGAARRAPRPACSRPPARRAAPSRAATPAVRAMSSRAACARRACVRAPTGSAGG